MAETTWWPHNPCTRCGLYILRFGDCLWWLLRGEFGSIMWRCVEYFVGISLNFLNFILNSSRIEAFSRCCWCNIHGCRKFCSRIGDCCYRRILCQGRHRNKWCHWIRRLQYYVCNIGLRVVLRNCLPIELVAIGARLLLLLLIHSCHVGYHL